MKTIQTAVTCDQSIVINEKAEEIIYQNNWITNHKITENNVEEIVKAGRSRWKVDLGR